MRLDGGAEEREDAMELRLTKRDAESPTGVGENGGGGGESGDGGSGGGGSGGGGCGGAAGGCGDGDGAGVSSSKESSPSLLRGGVEAKRTYLLWVVPILMRPPIDVTSSRKMSQKLSHARESVQ